MNMKSFIHKVHAHSTKESNWDVSDKAEEMGFENPDKLKYLAYEVEFEVEVFEDSTNKVLKIRGIDVSDKNISI